MDLCFSECCLYHLISLKSPGLKFSAQLFLEALVQKSLRSLDQVTYSTVQEFIAQLQGAQLDRVNPPFEEQGRRSHSHVLGTERRDWASKWERVGWVCMQHLTVHLGDRGKILSASSTPLHSIPFIYSLVFCSSTLSPLQPVSILWTLSTLGFHWVICGAPSIPIGVSPKYLQTLGSPPCTLITE